MSGKYLTVRNVDNEAAMNQFERHIVLPQTISVSIEGKQLKNALEVDRFPHMRDERDEPGTVESGRSRLDRRRHYLSDEENHPVPAYNGGARIRISRGGDGFFSPFPKDFDVIQATSTAMSPEVAKAFKYTMAEDPTHPFVLAHLNDQWDLNGSDSWLTIGGPALAIPLTGLDRPRGRSGRGQADTPPEPEGEIVELEVHVDNYRGVRSEDFIRAARRNESLDLNGITVGPVEMISMEPLRHRTGENELTGREVAMFKLAHDGATMGLFDSLDAVQAALTEELETGSSYPTKKTLMTGSSRSDFRIRYTVEGCLVLDGKEVSPSLSTELVEAKAVVKVRKVTLEPGRKAPHIGWMLVWQAHDWHRNPETLIQHLDLDGTVLSESRSRWGY